MPLQSLLLRVLIIDEYCTIACLGEIMIPNIGGKSSLSLFVLASYNSNFPTY